MAIDAKLLHMRAVAKHDIVYRECNRVTVGSPAEATVKELLEK